MNNVGVLQKGWETEVLNHNIDIEKWAIGKVKEMGWIEQEGK